MNKKNIFDMLENAEDDSMDILTDNCPDVSDEQLERLLSESERRYTMKKEEIERNKNIANTENTEQNEEIVSGVDRIKRPVWVRPLALAASVVLIAGTVVGSVALMKNAKPEKNNKSQATQTEAVATTQVTTQDIASEKITKEWLIDRFKDGKIYANKYYRESNTRFGRRIEAFDRENGIAYRKYFKQERDQGTSFDPLSGTFKTSVTTGQDESLEYMYKNKHLSLYINGTGEPTLNIDDEILYVESPSYYLKDADNVTLKGEEEYLGRNCAVIIYAPPPTGAEDEDYNKVEQWIDIETGTVLRAATIGEDDLKTEYTTETLAFYTEDEAASHIPTPQEFKQMIEPFGVKTEGRTDLDFLDETPIAVTTDASEIVTEIATNSETVPATEVETEDVPQEKTFAEAETESAQPATQAPAEIDKDYILDLVSNRKNNINRVYAKVKMCDETYDEVEKVKEVDGYDVTIQYDKDKDCFCEYVNDETSDRHSQIDMIMYKEKWVAVYKWLKNYHIISDIGAHAVTDRIDLYTRGKCSYPTLEQTLAKKNKWSITGRETVNGKDCAVVEYINKEHEIEDPVKYVMYIDIKTGIVMKSNATYYANALCKEAEAWGKSSFEITELKLNDDAPALNPSDFKKFVKDNGFEPEDEESKDLSFLDN